MREKFALACQLVSLIFLWLLEKKRLIPQRIIINSKGTLYSELDVDWKNNTEKEIFSNPILPDPDVVALMVESLFLGTTIFDQLEKQGELNDGFTIVEAMEKLKQFDTIPNDLECICIDSYEDSGDGAAMFYMFKKAIDSPYLGSFEKLYFIVGLEGHARSIMYTKVNKSFLYFNCSISKFSGAKYTLNNEDELRKFCRFLMKDVWQEQESNVVSIYLIKMPDQNIDFPSTASMKKFNRNRNLPIFSD
uniref:Uncharacterized protein n=1 Tax=Acrobeloides nanus TaxID=290746 RepID=A0A914C3F5_9BILA